MSLADVTTPAEVEALAGRILAARARPLLLVSTDADGHLLFDVGRLRSELDGIAEVVTIATGTATHVLEQLLPPKSHVFGGAARSYPGDFGRDPDWSRSHLRFPTHADADDLINDAMAQTGRRTVESAPAPSIRRVSGIVKGFVAEGTRAMVQLDDGSTVTATGALLPPDIPLMTALVVGAPVSGIIDGTELHPEPVTPDLSVYPDGAVTLALVVKVTDLRATVHLHPRIAIVLRRRDVDSEQTPVNDVLSVGDVIRVRVRREPGHELALSHADVDPAAPVLPALAVVAGGAPWLSEDRPGAHEASDAVSIAVPDAAASPASPPQSADAATRRDVAMLSSEITAMRGDLLALANRVARLGGTPASPDAEIARLQAENEQLRTKLAQERAERANAEAKLAEASQDRRESGARAARCPPRRRALPRGRDRRRHPLRDRTHLGQPHRTRRARAVAPARVPPRPGLHRVSVGTRREPAEQGRARMRGCDHRPRQGDPRPRTAPAAHR
ncbi:hypothetical protein QF046_002091 [Microbacterium sp. W4I4]|uniref:hypothetical protein n=1 Tax=Microbacterium sp. W4I4 TaxID=3042295 RepID=UPI00277EF8DB|nr:hypothetical protein [Microbacterium sp. W4I4]MDQ0614450.1 hypothetical protein [Microbacterium sp. W4I4]